MRKKGVDDTDLIAAIKAGNEDEVKSLIEKKIDVNQPGKHITSPLIHALPYPALLRHLLEAKADVHLSDMFHAQPLHYAAKGKQIESIDILLDHKADINNQDNVYYLSPLATATKSGDLGSVELLVKRKASINQKNIRGISALMIAAKNGCTLIIQYLIKAKANIDYVDVSAQNALHYAQAEKKVEAVRFFKSTYLERQMFALISGLHPVQGAKSSLFLASKNSLWDKNVITIIKTMLDENKVVIPKCKW